MIGNTENKLKELETRMDKFQDILMKIKDDLKTQMRRTCNSNNFDKESMLPCNDRIKIQDILGHFDFERVHKIMAMLEWKWARGGHYDVPTIDELKAQAKELLIEAATERTCVSTGGFRAVYEADSPTDKDAYIGLEFVAVECEGFIDGDEVDGEDDEDDDPES